MSLGARIRFERQHKGWTQEELARASGFTVDQIARFESDQAPLSHDDAERVAAALEMTLAVLCKEPTGSATRRGIG